MSYNHEAQYLPPITELMKTFLTLNNSNQVTDSVHLIKGAENQLSLAFQTDERTGIYSPNEGEVRVVSFGYSCASFNNSSIKILNKYGGSLNLSFTNNNANSITITFPETTTRLLGNSDITISKTNNEATTISAGMVVKFDTAGDVLLAQADVTTNYGFGLAQEDIAASATGLIQLTGKLTLADWTDPTGLANLSEGEPYYLSDTTEGMLTLIPPTNAQLVGIALDSNTLLIKI